MASIDTALSQEIFDLAQRKRYRMYIITARRMISGEMLKYRNGFLIREAIDCPSPPQAGLV